MANTIQDAPYISQSSQTISKQKKNIKSVNNPPTANSLNQNNISFGKAPSENFWLNLKRFAVTMSDISEITTACIAAIGTGIIAPLVIMVSPGKGDKEDKDKKFFQAIRQPLSAVLALAFQVPATMAVTRSIDKLAYSGKYPKLFDDENIGSLIPDKKYIGRNLLTKDELSKALANFDTDEELQQKLRKEVLKEYKDSGLSDPDEATIQKRMNKLKKKFVKNDLVDKKRNELIQEKIDKLVKQNIVIEDVDLITDDIKDAALKDKEVARNLKDKINNLEKEHKLPAMTKFLKSIGINIGEAKTLKKKTESLKTTLVLEKLKTDMPELFKDTNDGKLARIKKYIEAKDKEAMKKFGNRKFYLSLIVNLFMVTASCYALNWAHPRLKEFIDKHKKNKEDSSIQKAGVIA